MPSMGGTRNSSQVLPLPPGEGKVSGVEGAADLLARGLDEFIVWDGTEAFSLIFAHVILRVQNDVFRGETEPRS
jgi:hypothetical protein